MSVINKHSDFSKPSLCLDPFQNAPHPLVILRGLLCRAGSMQFACSADAVYHSIDPEARKEAVLRMTKPGSATLIRLPEAPAGMLPAASALPQEVLCAVFFSLF